MISSLISVSVLLSLASLVTSSFVTIQSLPGWNGSLPSTWYSGFADVSPSPLGTQMFEHYIFVECETNPSTAPIVLFQNGGPGASSFFGLSVEMGQLLLNDASVLDPEYARTGVPQLQYNEFGWTQFANVLIFDFPPPVGFSYCSPPGPAGNGTSCGPWNDESTTAANYKALLGFFKDFPQFRSNDLHIIGESYAGVYSPMLAEAILDNQAQFAINLQGVGVIDGCQGNAVLCGNKAGPLQRGFGPWYDLNFFWGHGQVSSALYFQIRSNCSEASLRNGKLTPHCTNLVNKFNNNLGGYYGYNLYDTCTARGPFLPGHVTRVPWPRKVPVNPHRRKRGNVFAPVTHTGYTCAGNSMSEWLALPAARKALGVALNSNFFDEDNGNGFNYTVSRDNVLPIWSRLRKLMRTATFSADADPAINSFVLQDIFRDWWASEGVPVREEWRPWAFANNATFSNGYVEIYDNYWFVDFRGQGHMVPYYSPISSYFLFESFVLGKKLPNNS